LTAAITLMAESRPGDFATWDGTLPPALAYYVIPADERLRLPRPVPVNLIGSRMGG